MAVAQTPTLLSLDRFAAVLGLHPLHFNQVDANIGSGASRVCVEPIHQYSWQASDGVSREELALSIMEAEDDIARELGFRPAVTWEIDERAELLHPVTGWFSHGYDVRGDILSVKTKFGHVIAGGRKQKTLIQAADAIVYTDTDSDGYFETATVVTPTTVTDVEEIAIYYPGQAGDDAWEIRPTRVVISGGNATIVFRREQAVTKVLLEALDSVAVNGLTNGNFLTTVDVYRKYHDPSVQVQFVWRNVGGCHWCGDSGCGACELTVQTGCMTVKDKKLGIVTVSPGDWNADDSVFDSGNWFDVCRRPDYVRLWYRAGYVDNTLATPMISMARRWELAVAKLAISKLDRLICSCKAVSDVQSHWNVDLRRASSTQAQSSNYRVTNYELENNPFGSTIAAMDVWRLVKREGLGLVGAV